MKNKVTAFDKIDKNYIDFGLPFKDADVTIWLIDYKKENDKYFTTVEMEVNGKSKVFISPIDKETYDTQDGNKAMSTIIEDYFNDLQELYESGKEIVEKTITFWDKIKAFFKRLRNFKFILLLMPLLMFSCEKEEINNVCEEKCGNVVYVASVIGNEETDTYTFIHIKSPKCDDVRMLKIYPSEGSPEYFEQLYENNALYCDPY